MPQGQRPTAGHGGGFGYSPGNRRGMVDGWQGLMDRAIGNYGEMASLLMDMLSRMAGGYSYGGYGCDDGADWHSPFAPPDTYLCTSIPVDFKSNRLCEVALDLHPYTDLAKLKMGFLDLVAENPGYPSLGNAAWFALPVPSPTTGSAGTIAGSGASAGKGTGSGSGSTGGAGTGAGATPIRPVLHIEVPPTAACCLYQAKVFDDKDQQCGTLTLFLG